MNILKTTLNSSLFKSGGIYLFSRVIYSSISILLLPFLTRYLSPTDYGIVIMFTALVTFVNPFTGLNIHASTGIRYFDGEDTDLPTYIGSCFFLLGINIIIVSTIFVFFANFISKITAIPADYLWMVIVICAGTSITRILLTLWQVQRNAFKYGLFLNLQTLAKVSLILLFVIGFKRSWKGALEAELFTIFISTILAMIILLKKNLIRFKFNKSYFKSAVNFGFPLIPHDIGAILITQTDRFFITNMINVGVTGIYSVGLQLGRIIELFASSFNLAYSPWLFKQLKKDDIRIKIKIVKFTYLYFVLILLFALFLSWALPFFLRIFVGDKFADASKYVPWFSFGFAFSGMYYMVANFIFFSGKTWAIAVVTTVCAIANIFANYILIKINGPLGAAQATAFVFLLNFIAVWLLSAKVYKMPWNLKQEDSAGC